MLTKIIGARACSSYTAHVHWLSLSVVITCDQLP